VDVVLYFGDQTGLRLWRFRAHDDRHPYAFQQQDVGHVESVVAAADQRDVRARRRRRFADRDRTDIDAALRRKAARIRHPGEPVLAAEFGAGGDRQRAA
jgi:hypothetical protein